MAYESKLINGRLYMTECMGNACKHFIDIPTSGVASDNQICCKFGCPKNEVRAVGSQCYKRLFKEMCDNIEHIEDELKGMTDEIYYEPKKNSVKRKALKKAAAKRSE